VDKTERQVLAVRQAGYEPYVVWSYAEDGQTYWGHYFGSLEEAHQYLSNGRDAA